MHAVFYVLERTVCSSSHAGWSFPLLVQSASFLSFIYCFLYCSLVIHTYITKLSISNCLQFADNKELQSEWREAKRITKEKVVSFIKEKTGYLVSPDAMFDVQVVPYLLFNLYILVILYFINIYYRIERGLQHNGACFHSCDWSTCLPSWWDCKLNHA